MTYLCSLGITLASEVPVVAAVFWQQWLRMAVIAAVATTSTHWVMHYVLPQFTTSYEQNVRLGEALAVVAEALAYAGVSRPPDLARGLIASGLANALSYLAGLVALS